MKKPIRLGGSTGSATFMALLISYGVPSNVLYTLPAHSDDDVMVFATANGASLLLYDPSAADMYGEAGREKV
jgi:hypothetical protein